MRGIRPPALFELRAQSRPPAKARNAVDLHHLPEGTHSLAPRPGPLVRLTFQKWCPWPDSHRHWRRFELRASALGYTGGRAHGRICTDTVRVLSALPLRWATWA